MIMVEISGLCGLRFAYLFKCSTGTMYVGLVTLPLTKHAREQAPTSVVEHRNNSVISHPPKTNYTVTVMQVFLTLPEVHRQQSRFPEVTRRWSPIKVTQSELKIISCCFSTPGDNWHIMFIRLRVTQETPLVPLPPICYPANPTLKSSPDVFCYTDLNTEYWKWFFC